MLLTNEQFIENGKIHQEFQFSHPMKTDSMGHSVINTMKQFFNEKKIPIKNILLCATDIAASMVGHYPGFIACLRREISNDTTINYIIHRQHLVSRDITPHLNTSLSTVIATVNKIISNQLKALQIVVF